MDTEKKDSHQNSIGIWIITSIIAHLLLVLLCMTLHLSKSARPSFKKTKNQFALPSSAILLMDKPQKAINPSLQKTQEPKQSPIIPQKEVAILRPGKQGIIDQQNLTPDFLSKLHQPQYKKIIDQPIPAELVQKFKTPKQQETITQNKKVEQAEKSKNQNEPTPQQNITPQETKRKHIQETEQKTEHPQTESIQAIQEIIMPSTKKIISTKQKQASNDTSKAPSSPKEQTAAKASTTSAEPEKQSLQDESTKKSEAHQQPQIQPQENDPYRFVPKPRHTHNISFKNLNLEFDKTKTNIGNNGYLIQYGNTTAIPNQQDLKMITYNTQFAKVIIESVHAHANYKQIQHLRQIQCLCSFTIDRQGHLLDMHILKRSSNNLFNKIVMESAIAAGLYPALPYFITDSPFIAQWTIIQ